MLRTCARLSAAVVCGTLAVVGPAPAATGDSTTGDSTTKPANAVADRADTATGRHRPVRVRVGTFNIKSVDFDKRPTRDWRRRKAVIVDQIIRKRLDVVGIQEAHYGHYTGVKYDDGPNQYLDLLNALTKAGHGTWRVTSRAAFNCRNRTTPRNCEHVDRNASRGTRIFYNRKRIKRVEHDAKSYKLQATHERFLAWGVFQVRGTDHRFLFTNTHLSPRLREVRVGQWRQSIKVTKRLRKRLGLPVIAVGDYTAQKWHPIAGEMLPAMRKAGFGDVVNQQYRSNRVPNPRAHKLVRAWIGSFNRGRRDVTKFSVPPGKHMVASSLDYIFASNHLPVRRYEMVVDFDRETMKVTGRLPSDHNLIKAVLRLP